MKKQLLLFFALSFSILAHANFTKTNGKITQTGTDNNLSGLSGIDGVTVINSNGNQGNNGFKIYIIDKTIRFILEGTLTIDPDKERLIIDNQTTQKANIPPLLINGTLIYGKELQNPSNGAKGYSSGTGLILTEKGDNYYSHASIVVNNNGKVIMNGGVIRISGVFVFQNGAYFEQNSGTIYNANAEHATQLRIKAKDQTNYDRIELNNLTLDGLTMPISLFTNSSFKKAVVTFKRGLFQTYVKDQPNLELLNFNNLNNLNNIDFTYNTKLNSATPMVTIFNAARKVSKAALEGNDGRFAYLKTVRKVELDFKDKDGVTISNVTYYGKDYDNNNNNNRFVGPSIHSNLADEIYEGKNASTPIELDMLVEVFISLENTENEDDRTNPISGTIPICAIGYNYTISKIKPTLYGLGTNEITTVLLPDYKITENNLSIVDNYSSITNSYELYDIAKSYLVENYEGETETLLIRTGKDIDLKDYNLKIDQNASLPFSINNNTITIKSTNFIGNIKTNGNIEVVDGSFIEGTFTDSTETCKFVFLDWNAPTEETIKIIDQKTGATLFGPKNATNFFKGHFSLPEQQPTNDIKVRISSNIDDTEYFTEDLLDEKITYINLNVILSKIATETNQLKIIKITEILLLKIAAINKAIDKDAVTPTITKSTTAVARTEIGTVQNQKSMLRILTRLLKKVTVSRTALKNN